MARFRLSVLLILLVVMVAPLLSSCSVAPHRDRYGRSSDSSVGEE